MAVQFGQARGLFTGCRGRWCREQAVQQDLLVVQQPAGLAEPD
jgi:hypothetical protein